MSKNKILIHPRAITGGLISEMAEAYEGTKKDPDYAEDIKEDYQPKKMKNQMRKIKSPKMNDENKGRY